MRREKEKWLEALIRERDELAQQNAELRRRVEVELAARRITEADRSRERAQAAEAVGCVVHDLNNVLAGITSGLELLARCCEQPERRAVVMKRIEDAAWRGCDLTRRLTAFARDGDGAAPTDGGAADKGSLMTCHEVAGAVPGRLSVLVVEDNDEMAEIATDMLRRLGHHGLRVSSMDAAITLLSDREAVDLIFADVLLGGGGSGLDLVREVERRRPGLPIVLTSGFGGGMGGRLETARLPLLHKPYSLAALQQALQRAALVRV